MHVHRIEPDLGTVQRIRVGISQYPGYTERCAMEASTPWDIPGLCGNELPGLSMIALQILQFAVQTEYLFEFVKVRNASFTNSLLPYVQAFKHDQVDMSGMVYHHTYARTKQVSYSSPVWFCRQAFLINMLQTDARSKTYDSYYGFNNVNRNIYVIWFISFVTVSFSFGLVTHRMEANVRFRRHLYQGLFKIAFGLIDTSTFSKTPRRNMVWKIVFLQFTWIFSLNAFLKLCALFLKVDMLNYTYLPFRNSFQLLDLISSKKLSLIDFDPRNPDLLTQYAADTTSFPLFLEAFKVNPVIGVQGNMTIVAKTIDDHSGRVFALPDMLAKHFVSQRPNLTFIVDYYSMESWLGFVFPLNSNLSNAFTNATLFMQGSLARELREYSRLYDHESSSYSFLDNLKKPVPATFFATIALVFVILHSISVMVFLFELYLGNTRRETWFVSGGLVYMGFQVNESNEKRLTCILGCVECGFVLASLLVMVIGSGFHLVQGWRAFDNATDSLLECGIDILLEKKSNNDQAEAEPVLILTQEPSLKSSLLMDNNSCKVDGFPSLSVDDMQGYDGTCSIFSGLWEPLQINIQYFMCILCLINLIITVIMIRLVSLPFKKTIIVAAALNSQTVAVATSYSAFCSDYKSQTLKMFNKMMVAHDLSQDPLGNNLVVDCFLTGFTIAAALAQLACVMYTGHFFILSTLRDVKSDKSSGMDDTPSSLAKEIEFDSKVSKKPKPAAEDEESDTISKTPSTDSESSISPLEDESTSSTSPEPKKDDSTMGPKRLGMSKRQPPQTPRKTGLGFSSRQIMRGAMRCLPKSILKRTSSKEKDDTRRISFDPNNTAVLIPASDLKVEPWKKEESFFKYEEPQGSSKNKNTEEDFYEDVPKKSKISKSLSSLRLKKMRRKKKK